jgi:membrane protease YdiL (CAAX protease family)
LASGHAVVPYEPRRPVPWGPIALVFGAVLYVLLPSLAAYWICRWNGLMQPGPLQELPPTLQMRVLVAASLASILAAGVAAAFIGLGTGCSLRDFGWDPRRMLGDLWLGLRAFLLLAPPVYVIQLVLVQWFPSEHPLIELIERQRDVRWLLASGVVAVLAAPLVEEFFFRMLLQGWLEKLGTRHPGRMEESPDELRLPGQADPVSIAAMPGVAEPSPGVGSPGLDANNPYVSPSPDSDGLADDLPDSSGMSAAGVPPRWPILFSATLFAAMHWTHGPDPIPLFVLGLGLGYLYRQTHRILPCIVVHLLLNLTTLLALAAYLFG